VREGYGIVVIEANACGTPAIGWKVAGLKDSIVDGYTGLLVPFDDVRKLGETISQFLRDSHVQTRMTSSAVQWARTHSWNRAADEFARVLESTMLKAD
jgi:glycosyltransferase involved in cell wall biosynthesis